MLLAKVRLSFRPLCRSLDVFEGLHSQSPAARLTGYHTCQTVSVSSLCNQSILSRGLLSKGHKAFLKTPWTTSVRNVTRKLYPDPFERDPEYYLLPEEPKTNLNLKYVPELSNNGPELVKKVHEAVTTGKMGRLFAVIHIDGQQRKVTTEDLVVVDGFFPPQIGEKIRLEKVMALGSKDFTLLGRPLLDRDLVKIEATVIEKTVSHVKFDYTQKKRFRRLKLTQHPQTVLVINSIQINPAALS